MDQENAVTEIVESQSKPREAFDIEGIGEFRAKPGTAVHEIAGAASYWQKRAKEAFAVVESHGKTKWRDGFTAGMSAALAIGALAAGIFHFFGH